MHWEKNIDTCLLFFFLWCRCSLCSSNVQQIAKQDINMSHRAREETRTPTTTKFREPKEREKQMKTKRFFLVEQGKHEWFSAMTLHLIV